MDFKEITKGGGITKKMLETQDHFALGKPTIAKQVYNNGIDILSSYNLMEHYGSPFLQKEAIDIIAKGLIMLDIQSLENLPKKLLIFIAKFSLLLF